MNETLILSFYYYYRVRGVWVQLFCSVATKNKKSVKFQKWRNAFETLFTLVFVARCFHLCILSTFSVSRKTTFNANKFLFFSFILEKQFIRARVNSCFTWMYLECAWGLALPPSFWWYQLPGFSSASGGLFLLVPWFHPGWLSLVSLQGIGRLS